MLEVFFLFLRLASDGQGARHEVGDIGFELSSTGDSGDFLRNEGQNIKMSRCPGSLLMHIRSWDDSDIESLTKRLAYFNLTHRMRSTTDRIVILRGNFTLFYKLSYSTISFMLGEPVAHWMR